ncbi:MAG: ABC transporter ATP-binding protein [Alphaproteobacteria bacterium]|nr:ABC transporter ATP-binding protein [Alphaproteobacteria bacterium]
MSALPAGLRWPVAERGALVDRLARRAGLGAEVELHGVRVTYDALPGLVRGGGPAVLSVHDADGVDLIAVLGPTDLLGRVPLLSTDGRTRRVPVARVVAALRAGIEASQAGAVEALLDAAGVPGARRPRARAALLAERLRGASMGGGRLVRAAPHAPAVTQAREAGVIGPLGASLLTRALATGLGLAGWAVVGRGALDGRIAPGWVLGWALLMLTALVLERATAWHQGQLALRGGAWVKQTLLRGAMKADPEGYRADGVGGVLARVQESQAIEDLVLSGGLGAVLAGVDLLAAGWVLSRAPGGGWLVALLAAVVAGLLVAAARLRRLQGASTDDRRRLTHLLVERMVGHRTRLAQAAPARWHDDEDDALEAWHRSTRALDGHRVTLAAALQGGWSLAALSELGLQFALAPASPGALALALGGVLWAQIALNAVAGSLEGLVAASISWREIRGLLWSARRPPEVGEAVPPAAVGPGEVLLRAAELRYAWPGRPPVLDGVDLTLRAGDRVLLTGPSGGGKSTLAALMTGLRRPDGGLLLLAGLDPATLGEQRWRQLAVAAPQFHENHVFENSLGFNLLLGRAWPASPEELEEARQLCDALGLDELLARMPGGMGQFVGESGWRMSHGERSRVFLARALLQGAPLVVLDESFAALDPQTLGRCLDVALARAGTLVVIAHP